MRRGVEARYGDRVRGIRVQTLHIVRADQVWRALAGLVNLAWAAGVLVMLYFYLDYVFALFPWTRALGKSLLALTIDPLRTFGMGLILLVPNLLFLAILILVVRYALKLIRLFSEAVGDGRVPFVGFDPEWAWPTYRLVRLLVTVLAAVVAYPYIPGSASEAFKGVTLFLGIIFSLGSSSLIGNIIAGYSMTYRRAFRAGDLAESLILRGE